MNKVKLTLTLNADIIKQAKDLMQTENISLSQFFENYLMSVLQKKKKLRRPLSPITKSLQGMVPNIALDDEKELLTDILIDKHT